MTAAAKLRPEAVLLAPPATRASEALTALRGLEALRDVPVLADLSQARAESLRRLEVEDFVHSTDELGPRLEAALRSKRALDREAAAQLRMETLLDITQAATSSLQLDQILAIAVEKIGRVVNSDRCYVVLVEGQQSRNATVVASRELPDGPGFPLDLARYPELRRALETRTAVHVEDASHDPLMEEVRRHIIPLGVRSVLVQPLVCHDDLFGALFLRLSKSDDAFARADREFAQAASAAVANSIRNARLHAALRKKRDDLESAYVDRYRELLDANKRLKELNRLKDDLIAVCSHDLRAPLQVLLGHGKLLLDDDLTPEQDLSAKAIVRVGKKILGLAESLLEQGRGDLARVTLDPRLVDLSELCQDTVAELKILATSKQISLRAETPESLMALGDEMKLRQVLQNLITNAIQHGKEGGEVVVRTRRLKRPDGDAARIVVLDDGPGLAEGQLHVVFDKYRHGGTGTGLGLAIAKEFVELHGGEIWAENSPQGGGVFQISLPLSKTSQQTAPTSVEPAILEHGERFQVLVVEDEPEIATMVSEVLRARYRVELARDGAEGLAKARTLRPDLVVMDVFLPKLDGLDAAVALKSSNDTADIPVILLSAHRGISEKVRALGLGAVDYLGKPVDTHELLTRTERALQLRATERELRRSQALLQKSGRDVATGLLSKVGLLSRLEQERARSHRYGRKLTVAVLVPLEPPRDRLGRCAAVIRSRLRTPDVVAHLGDGVFGLMLPESVAQLSRVTLARLCVEVREETGVSFRAEVEELSETLDSPAVVLDRLNPPAS